MGRFDGFNREATGAFGAQTFSQALFRIDGQGLDVIWEALTQCMVFFLPLVSRLVPVESFRGFWQGRGARPGVGGPKEGMVNGK